MFMKTYGENLINCVMFKDFVLRFAINYLFANKVKMDIELYNFLNILSRKFFFSDVVLK